MYSWIEQRMESCVKKKPHSQKNDTFGVKTEKSDREKKRENQRVFQTQCCITAGCH